jgi:hypothetical protein
MYDYLLGGKDHFAVDRETMEAGLRSWPGACVYARENRKFLARAVEYLVDRRAFSVVTESFSPVFVKDLRYALCIDTE